jgi:hypothetical protein
VAIVGRRLRQYNVHPKASFLKPAGVCLAPFAGAQFPLDKKASFNEPDTLDHERLFLFIHMRLSKGSNEHSSL